MVKGTIVPVVTPFTAEGEIDEKAYKNLIDWHVSENVDVIITFGTTGEAPTLTDEEQHRLLKIALDVSNKRVPIYAGTGTYDTRKTIKNTEHAKELGADGCLLVVPYYNKPTPEGCIAHYTAINKVGLPMMVYHHPGRTGIKLSAQTLAEICHLSNVVALKDCAADFELLQEFCKISETPVISGDDTLVYKMMELGAKGICSVVANVIPGPWKEMTASFLRGDRQRAKEIETQYAPLYNALTLETNPMCVKYAVSLLGKCEPYMRLPLVQPKDATKLAILQAMSSVMGSALIEK